MSFSHTIGSPVFHLSFKPERPQIAGDLVLRDLKAFQILRHETIYWPRQLPLDDAGLNLSSKRRHCRCLALGRPDSLICPVGAHIDRAQTISYWQWEIPSCPPVPGRFQESDPSFPLAAR